MAIIRYFVDIEVENTENMNDIEIIEKGDEKLDKLMDSGWFSLDAEIIEKEKIND